MTEPPIQLGDHRGFLGVLERYHARGGFPRLLGATTLSIASLLLLHVAPQQAVAQQLLLDTSVGLTIPTGSLAGIVDPGPAFSGGISYLVSSRIAVRLGLDVSVLNGSQSGEVPTPPDIRLWQYGAGVQFFLVDPDRSRWQVAVHISGGATSFDSSEFVTNVCPPRRVCIPEQQEFSTTFSLTYPMAAGGLGLSYNLSRTVAAVFSLRSRVTFLKREDTRVFTIFGQERFSTAWNLPVLVGVQVALD